MKKFSVFILHVVIAIPVAMVSGFLLNRVLSHWFGNSPNPWLDASYSPLLWGWALALGVLIGILRPSSSARWIWVFGVLWFTAFAASSMSAYDPRWCDGCSRAQYFWYDFFSYSNPVEEGMGQLLVTWPMINSIAYSLGAMLAQKFSRAGTQSSGAKRRPGFDGDSSVSNRVVV